MVCLFVSDGEVIISNQGTEQYAAGC